MTDVDPKLAILVGSFLFLVIYGLYLMQNWVALVGVVLCIVFGIIIWKIMDEDWDKKIGFNRMGKP